MAGPPARAEVGAAGGTRMRLGGHVVLGAALLFGCGGSSPEGSGGTGVPPDAGKPDVGPTERCAGLAAPPPIAMQQHVAVPDGPPVWCRAAAGDANGTLAFPYVFTYAMAHGSSVEFATTAGEAL